MNRGRHRRLILYLPVDSSWQTLLVTTSPKYHQASSQETSLFFSETASRTSVSLLAARWCETLHVCIYVHTYTLPHITTHNVHTYMHYLTAHVSTPQHRHNLFLVRSCPRNPPFMMCTYMSHVCIGSYYFTWWWLVILTSWHRWKCKSRLSSAVKKLTPRDWDSLQYKGKKRGDKLLLSVIAWCFVYCVS